MKKTILVDPQWKNGIHEGPNIKLAYAAAVLEQLGTSVEVIDFVEKNKKYSTVMEYELRKRLFIQEIASRSLDADTVYVNCEYGQLKSALDISKEIKKQSPKTLTTVGGTFINYLHAAQQLTGLKQSLGSIDKVVIGDVELMLPSIIFGKGYESLNNSHFVQNLDSLPNPDWSKFNLHQYADNLYLLATRGCPYNKCTFCDEKLIWGNTFRHRSPSGLITEIKRNQEIFGKSKFFFWDAAITAYPDLEKFSEIIYNEAIQISWIGLGRVRDITLRTAELIKRSGCEVLEIGIESGNDSLLKIMNKGCSKKQIKEATKTLKSVGIKVEGSFLIGQPQETLDTAQRTLEFAQELELDYCRWHNFQPSSSFFRDFGTEIYHGNWCDTDINCPNNLLEYYLNSDLAFSEMHTAIRLTSSATPQYPAIKIGALSIEEIIEFTRKADKITNSNNGILHNPYI